MRVYLIWEDISIVKNTDDACLPYLGRHQLCIEYRRCVSTLSGKADQTMRVYLNWEGISFVKNTDDACLP